MKIIILKRDKLGDLLLTTPMLQVLKKLYPKSKLAVVAPESSAWILKNATFIDQLYSYPQPKAFNLKSFASIFIQLFIFFKIRLEHYDFAIAAGGEYSHRAIKRLFWIKAQRTISFVPHNKIIPEITELDGTCKTMELKYWDFRFSNLCNMKCRSCGPRYSSAWVPDAKKLGYADQEKVWSIDQVGTSTNYDFLKDQVQHVQKIYFAGGEPLLMPEHWQILDMLVEHKRFDVKVSYNTNASTLMYGKKNVLDYWKQWDNWKIEVWPSIDEIDERAEIIRSGTVWSKVEGNLKEMVKLDNIVVRPGLTIGAWNVHRLPEIINRLVEIGVVRKKHKFQNFFINLLFDPTHYHMHILPDDFRQATIEKLEKFIIEHNKKYDTTIDHLFTHTIHELKQPFNLLAAKKFLKVTDQVDAVRDEKLLNIIPELKIIRSIVNEKNI